MERREFRWLKALVFGGALLSFFACSDEGTASKADVDFEITDAPSDDASIKSVMVTIAEVKVNGETLSGFTKQTIDLKAYQEGRTKLLGTSQLDARTYSSITLVLDTEMDQNGNQPGCYVLTTSGEKLKLANSTSGQMNVTANQTWKLASEIRNKVIIDFDLRKSIKYTQDASAQYSFVSESNMNAALRVVTAERAGTINGSYQEESPVQADKIFVYAYRKGTFNASAEAEAQTSDNIYFRNAVASAEVKQTVSGRTYTLAFLEEGDYELHFVGYSKNSETGRYAMSSQLKSETTAEGSLSNIVTVKAGMTINISATIKGVI
jgi:hypothetical protein